MFFRVLKIFEGNTLVKGFNHLSAGTDFRRLMSIPALKEVYNGRRPITYRPLGYERVHLPLCKVADTPFHIQGDDMYSNEVEITNLTY